MPTSTTLTGILLMLSSTALFVLGDSCLKLASTDLPPFQLVFLRSVIALSSCAVFATLTDEWRIAPRVHKPRVLARSLAEACAAIFFMLGLANLPIADAFAIAQTVPLFILIGAAFFYRDRLTLLQIVLMLVGFAGALLVAQPGLSGAAIGFVFAFGAAVAVASRDLIGRAMANNLPVAILTAVTNAMVIVLAGGFMWATEGWRFVSGLNFLYVLAAGFCVALGQAAVVLAYRRASTTTLAPLFYSFAVWSVLSGLLVFGDLPNSLALFGIVLIVGSGLLLVWINDRAGAR
jgi:drug/metabolite transporter (DMT)-like permease